MTSGAARALGAAWMAGEPAAATFLSLGFADPTTRVSAVARARRQALSAPVAEALRAELGADRPRAAAALARLEAGGAACVVTGQQAGLFLGPLYTFHKALGAVLAAAALEAESDSPVVPVFWIQDEDHDFDEVAVYRFLVGDGALETLRLADLAPRVAVGDRAIPAEVGRLRARLEASLRGARFEDEARALLEPWSPGEAWSRAFAESLRRVFGDEPLLFLRGRCPLMARAQAPLQARCLVELDRVGAALEASAEVLGRAGWRVQIEPRPACALGFFHPDGPSGPRLRPERVANGVFRMPGRPGALRLDALLERLEREPGCFSTSALLRVLVQDSVLPVAAQMLGPGEASYLGQLGSLRALLAVPEPLPVPRARARWLEPVVRRRLRDLGVTGEAAIGDPDLLLAELAPVRPDLAPSALRAALLDPLAHGLADLGPLEPELERARHRTLRSVERQIGRFVGRVARVEARRDATRARRLAEARLHLLPGGAPQERTLGMIELVARHGLQRLKACFRDAYVPFETGGMELAP